MYLHSPCWGSSSLTRKNPTVPYLFTPPIHRDPPEEGKYSANDWVLLNACLQVERAVQMRQDRAFDLNVEAMNAAAGSWAAASSGDTTTAQAEKLHADQASMRSQLHMDFAQNMRQNLGTLIASDQKLFELHSQWTLLLLTSKPVRSQTGTRT